jgi:hypothetical protein
MARYKVTKEQLERVVESFVMESTKKTTKTISESDMKMVNLISEKYNIDKKIVIKEMEMINEFDENTWMKNYKITKRSYKSLTGKDVSPEEEKDILDKAREENFEGKVTVSKKGPEGELVYVSSKDVTGKAAKLPWWKRLGGRDSTMGK